MRQKGYVPLLHVVIPLGPDTMKKHTRSFMDKTTLLHLPLASGVYTFVNQKGEILYIGKAKNIRKRILQHFQQTKNASPKNKKMIMQIQDVRWTQTDNEVEALILENTLIKEHHPKYNILMRDDKNFLYIRISLEEEYPQLSMVRRITNPESYYLGPYVQASSIRETFHMVGKIFPYECLTFFRKGITQVPCFNYHIQRCPGLCIGAVTKESYRSIVQKIVRFLQGDITDLVKELDVKMKEESKKHEFEKAAKTRDNLVALRTLIEKQKVIDPNIRTHRDVLAFVTVHRNIFTSILKIRHGVLVKQENFTFTIPSGDMYDQRDIMEHVVQAYYEATMSIPPEIIVPVPIQDKSLLEQWLCRKRGGSVKINYPLKGKKEHLLSLCEKNAQSYADKEMISSTMETGIAPAVGVKELQKYLSSQHPLRRIECYDIAHLSGTSIVASMVVFLDGKAQKSDYRQFKIHTTEGKSDDYQSLREVLERRLKYLINPVLRKMIKSKKESFLQHPNLIILDGGKGQVSVGIQVLSAFNLLKDIPVIGIAKNEETIYLSHQTKSLALPKDSQAQYLIERIRDEAHRFANAFHQRIRERRMSSSLLDKISGLGKKAKKKLVDRFGSLREVRHANLTEIENTVGKKLASKIKERL